MRATPIAKLYHAGETKNTKLIEAALDGDNMRLKTAAIAVVQVFELRLDAVHAEKFEVHPVSAESGHLIHLLARRANRAWHRLLADPSRAELDNRLSNREYMLRIVARRGTIRHGFAANRNF
jgi:hypothetical protein